jgi:hypothetical protein
MQPCAGRRFHRHILQISIRGTETDTGQSRERHGGPGEGVDEEAYIVLWEYEVASAGAIESSKAAAGKAERLGAG